MTTRRIATAAAALILALMPSSMRAQGMLEVKRVPSDSLVRFMRSQCGGKVYFIKDKEDVASYSVSAPKEGFVKAALEELRSKGYTISSYDGMWFVMSGSAISADALPAGFFDEREARVTDDGLSQLRESETQMATFRNKIYEIGEHRDGRTGKAFVRGYVRDITSGEPLAGIAVYDNKGAYVATDGSGFYRIALPIGDNVLNFSGYSLEDLALNLLVHDDGGLDVVMKEKVTSLKGAVVTAQGGSAHRDARMGIEKVQMNTVKKVPTAFGESDVLKVVLTLPGVKSVGEAATGFNVRGGATDQNLILFNGGTIYNPSHMFGLLSSFNTEVINGVELYKSSIPAEFGGRISSVLDVQGKEGNPKKLGGSLGLGMLTSSLEIDGPIVKDKTTFVLGGRTTYSNWMLNLLPSDSNYSGGRADFSDINVGVTHRFNDRNSLQAHTYWSRDAFAFSNDTTFRYSSLNASLKWRSHISESNTMTVTGGYDSFRNNLDNRMFANYAHTFGSRIQQGYGKVDFKSTLSSHVLSYGVHGLFYDLNPGELEALGDASQYVGRALDRQNAVEGALYVSDAWTATDMLSFEFGTRLTGYLATNPQKFYFYPEVRLSGKYTPVHNFSIKAGFNSMSQNIHMISNSTSISPMDTWHLASAKMRPQTGWQGAGGLYWTPGEGKMDISLEGYYKRMYHYADYMSGAVLVMNPDLEDFLVETTGKAYGAELMVRKNVGKLNGWLSYTYSRTFLREVEDRGIETINGGAWYNAPHDKPHDFKMVANYKFTHRYSLSVNADYSTGRPVTIPVGSYTYNGYFCLAYSDRNQYRIPDYFRMDVAMNVEPGHNLRQLAHLTFTFGVYNVTGRKNAYSVYYTATTTGAKGHMLSVFAVPIPYINLNLKF